MLGSTPAAEEIAAHSDGLFQRFNRLVESIRHQQRDRAVEMKISRIQAGVLRLLEVKDRLAGGIRRFARHVRHRQSKQRVRLIRIERRGALKSSNRLIKTMRMQIRLREVVNKRRILRSLLSRAFKQRNSRRCPAGLHVQHAEPMQCVRILRIGLESRLR